MTVATTVLTNLPVQGEMLDENGHLTQAWRLFFQGMYVRIGGQAAPSNLVLGATTDSSAGAVASLTTATQNNTTNITNLTTTSNTNAITVSGLTTTSNTNAATVANLSTATNSNTTNISTLTTTSNTNATTVSNLTTSTNNNTTAITNLTSVVNATPGAVLPITVSASPFTFQASKKGALIISAGTVTSIQITRDGTTFYNAGVLSGMFSLSTNDSAKVTYTAVPVLTFFPT